MNGSVKIDSALVVKDSVRINKSLRVDQDVRLLGLTKLNETKVLMDFTVQGLSKFNGELKANNDFISQGLAKFNGEVKITNLEEIANLNNKYVLLTNENGFVKRISVDSLMAKITIPPGSQLLNQFVNLAYAEPLFCEPNGTINNPTWANGPNKIFSPCPQVNVGIGTSVPTQKLDVRGKAYFSDYVGIGIQNPLYGLHVNESIKVNGELHAGNAGIGRDAETFAKLSIKNPSAPTALKIQSTNTNQYTKLLYMEYSEPSTEILKVYNTVTASTPYLFEANGKMTVRNGTAEIFKLYESGLLRVREVIIDNQNPWPDYVFEPTYTLKSLKELRSFIITNKHLPNVPSAKEVAENGVNIGEMNRVLLEKVEELTIYLLQQQDEIDALKGKLNTQK